MVGDIRFALAAAAMKAYLLSMVEETLKQERPAMQPPLSRPSALTRQGSALPLAGVLAASLIVAILLTAICVAPKPFARSALAQDTAPQMAQQVPAEPSPKDEPSPEALALEGIGRLMRALSVFMETIPQYDLPEVNENGDIIIRRKNPPAAPEPAEPPEIESTKT